MQLIGKSHALGSFVPAGLGEITEFEKLSKKATRKSLLHERVETDVERALQEEGVKLK